MTPATRILVAFVAGLVAGVLALRVPALASLPRLVAPVGQLWLRALQVTIVPLVVALVVTGICSAAPTGTLGRRGLRLMALFAGLLLAAGTLGALVVEAALALRPLPPDVGASLALAPAPDAPAMAGGASWVDAIVPTNVVRAAVDGAMLPLVVFTLLFALALARVEPRSRDAVVRFFRALADTMLVLVGWVIQLAPLGVFAIAVPLVGNLGAAAGTVAYYVGLNVVVLGLVTLLLYPVGAWGARTSLPGFARALLPAQAVAATTRSSLATLPLMLDAARRLGATEVTAGFVLPLAVALFRITTPPAALITALFAAHFHGIALGAGTIALLVLASVGLSAGVVGVPGQASYFVTRLPMFTMAGIPMDLLAPLLAVDVLSDVFRTVGNVTADVAVTTLVEQPAEASARDVLLPDASEGTAQASAAP